MKQTRCIALIFVLLTLATGTALAEIHNILDYGAKADGVFENAQSIQKAIDAASEAGGGVVLFPPGEYRTATIFLKDNVTLRLDKGCHD